MLLIFCLFPEKNPFIVLSYIGNFISISIKLKYGITFFKAWRIRCFPNLMVMKSKIFNLKMINRGPEKKLFLDSIDIINKACMVDS